MSRVSVERVFWGALADGTPLHLFKVDDGSGFAFAASELGASLISLWVPDRDGQVADVLVGFKTAEGLLSAEARATRPCFGSIVGRVANRIAGAGFVIDGRPFALLPNEGANQLHGGPDGFDRRVWAAQPLADGVRFSLQSEDADQGYPGNLSVTVDYRLTGAREITTGIEARTDAPTHVNIAPHPYFNLVGHTSRSVEGHSLQIGADSVLAIDAEAIPLAPMAVDGTPFDFRAPATIRDRLAAAHPQIAAGDGLNHCFVLQDGGEATLREPLSGRQMTLRTTEPGLQVYTANALDGSLAEHQASPFVRRQAIAFEPQHFPDSPNRPDFPSTLLRPGKVRRSVTTLRFTS